MTITTALIFPDLPTQSRTEHHAVGPDSNSALQASVRFVSMIHDHVELLMIMTFCVCEVDQHDTWSC